MACAGGLLGRHSSWRTRGGQGRERVGTGQDRVLARTVRVTPSPTSDASHTDTAPSERSTATRHVASSPPPVWGMTATSSTERGRAAEEPAACGAEEAAAALKRAAGVIAAALSRPEEEEGRTKTETGPSALATTSAAPPPPGASGRTLRVHRSATHSRAARRYQAGAAAAVSPARTLWRRAGAEYTSTSAPRVPTASHAPPGLGAMARTASMDRRRPPSSPPAPSPRRRWPDQRLVAHRRRTASLRSTNARPPCRCASRRRSHATSRRWAVTTAGARARLAV